MLLQSTGDPHVGTAYMAFDKAWSRKTGGPSSSLRIEDTDRNRLVEGSEQQIYDSLRWLGLEADESPGLVARTRPTSRRPAPGHLSSVRRPADRGRPRLLLLVLG